MHLPALRHDLRRQLDLIERLVIIAIYIWLLSRFVGLIWERPANLLFLVAEGIVMVMVVLRHATDQITLRPADWIVGFAGSFVVMLVAPAEPLAFAGTIAPLLMLAGLAISIAAKLQLRRSFGIVAANRGVKTRGLYGLVRHPMYSGYFLVNGGMLMVNFSAWNLAVMAAWTMFQLMRIEAEERLLSADPSYRSLMERVRYRLVPGLY